MPAVYVRVKQRENLFEVVKHLFGTNARYNRALNTEEMPNSLSGYEFGKHIACGCNAAIYEMRLNDIHVGVKTHFNDSTETPSCSKEYPLAVKIMYNYDFSIPERYLWMEMGPEIIPLLELPPNALQGRMAKFKPLKRSHPNIIKMYTAFVDHMPILAGAEKLYPEALPNMYDFQTLVNEPKTLFVVMKRYRMTLREYVLTQKRNYWAGRVMFGQLLEAVVFLHEHKISHRDMKSDNILLDFDTEEEVPHLVLSDFGCALAANDFRVCYDSENVDLGGNLALRAPEIRRAWPGPNVWLDFSLADMWSAATIAYEIFTRVNPFYSQLSSEAYEDAELPPLPRRVHHAVKRVCYEMLNVDPPARPKPQVAANVVLLSLFRFGQEDHTFFEQFGVQKETLELLHNHSTLHSRVTEFADKRKDRMNSFLQLYTTETIFSRRINPSVISDAELQLRATFLSRVDPEELQAAMAYHCVVDDYIKPPLAYFNEFPHYDNSDSSTYV